MKLSCIFLCFSAAMGWFAYAPDWYETNSKSFALSEAQSISIFVHYLLNDRLDGSADASLKARGRESELSNMVYII